jgi:hypothetical protein
MLLAIAGFAPIASAEIYRCDDASGQTTYQETRCDPGTVTQRAIVVEPPLRADPTPAVKSPPRADPAPATKPPPRADAPAATRPPPRAEPAPAAKPLPPSQRSDTDLALLLLIKIGCDDELPGFTPRTRDGYAAWRAQNLEQVQRIERSEGYRLSLVQYRLERALRPVSPAPASAPAPDPKATVRHYADALCYGNVAAALGVQVRP